MKFRFTRYGLPQAVAGLSDQSRVVYDSTWTTRLGEVHRDPVHATRWFARYDGTDLPGWSQSRQHAASRLADEHRRIWGQHALDG